MTFFQKLREVCRCTCGGKTHPCNWKNMESQQTFLQILVMWFWLHHSLPQNLYNRDNHRYRSEPLGVIYGPQIKLKITFFFPPCLGRASGSKETNQFQNILKSNVYLYGGLFKYDKQGFQMAGHVWISHRPNCLNSNFDSLTSRLCVLGQVFRSFPCLGLFICETKVLASELESPRRRTTVAEGILSRPAVLFLGNLSWP